MSTKSGMDVVVACYSYKGGSGRTTAAVNLSGALMAQGQRVVCLDMDFGSPGVRMVLCQSFFSDQLRVYLGDEEGQARDPMRDPVFLPPMGIHEFLDSDDQNRKIGMIETYACDYWTADYTARENPESPVRPFRLQPDESLSAYKADLEEEYIKACNSMLTEKPGTLARQRPRPPLELYDASEYYHSGDFERGRLLFIAGSTTQRHLRVLDSRLRFQRQFARLQSIIRQYLDNREPEREGETIFYVLDAASGISRLSLPTLQLADLVLVFFRWSIQHYHGTKDNIPILKSHLEDACQGGLQLALVGNCTPTPEFEAQLKLSSHPQLVKAGDWFERERRRLLEKTDWDWKTFDYLGDILDENLLRINEKLAVADYLQGNSEDAITHRENLRQFLFMGRYVKLEGERFVRRREARWEQHRKRFRNR